MAKNRYDGRTLREVLRDLPDKQIVKIGTDDGSGYFLAGEAGWINKQLESADYLVRKDWEKRRDRAMELLRQVMNAPTYADWLRSQWLASDTDPHKYAKRNLSHEAYLKEIGNYHLQIDRRIKRVTRFLDIIKDYVTLPDRKVIEMAETDPGVDVDVLRILTEGAESGSVWYMSEANGNQYLYIAKEGNTGEL